MYGTGSKTVGGVDCAGGVKRVGVYGGGGSEGMKLESLMVEGCQLGTDSRMTGSIAGRGGPWLMDPNLFSSLDW